MAGVLHVDGFTFEDVGEGLWGDGNRAMHELGNIIALHGETMGIGTGHRQFERTGGITILVNMGDERTGEGTIVTTTAEDDPSAIAGP